MAEETEEKSLGLSQTRFTGKFDTYFGTLCNSKLDFERWSKHCAKFCEQLKTQTVYTDDDRTDVVMEMKRLEAISQLIHNNTLGCCSSVLEENRRKFPRKDRDGKVVRDDKQQVVLQSLAEIKDGLLKENDD